MEIVSEPVGLQDVVVEADAEAPYAEAPEPAPEPAIDARHTRAPRAKAAPKARARKPAPALEPVVESVEPAEPVEPVAESAPAPKTGARQPAPAPAPAPAPSSLGDVLGMLAAALLDQRQTRTAQRREMYRSFLE